MPTPGTPSGVAWAGTVTEPLDAPPTWPSRAPALETVPFAFCAFALSIASFPSRWATVLFGPESNGWFLSTESFAASKVAPALPPAVPLTVFFALDSTPAPACAVPLTVFFALDSTPAPACAVPLTVFFALDSTPAPACAVPLTVFFALDSTPAPACAVPLTVFFALDSTLAPTTPEAATNDGKAPPTMTLDAWLDVVAALKPVPPDPPNAPTGPGPNPGAPRFGTNPPPDWMQGNPPLVKHRSSITFSFRIAVPAAMQTGSPPQMLAVVAPRVVIEPMPTALPAHDTAEPFARLS